MAQGRFRAGLSIPPADACSPSPALGLHFQLRQGPLLPTPGEPCGAAPPGSLAEVQPPLCRAGWRCGEPSPPLSLPSARCHLNSPVDSWAEAAGAGLQRPSRAARRRTAVQSRARRQRSHWLGAVTPRGAAAAASADWRAGGHPPRRARTGACRLGCAEAHRL